VRPRLQSRAVEWGFQWAWRRPELLSAGGTGSCQLGFQEANKHLPWRTWGSRCPWTWCTCPTRSTKRICLQGSAQSRKRVFLPAVASQADIVVLVHFNLARRNIRLNRANHHRAATLPVFGRLITGVVSQTPSAALNPPRAPYIRQCTLRSTSERFLTDPRLALPSGLEASSN
jgi:hypothetical protein